MAVCSSPWQSLARLVIMMLNTASLCISKDRRIEGSIKNRSHCSFASLWNMVCALLLFDSILYDSFVDDNQTCWYISPSLWLWMYSYMQYPVHSLYTPFCKSYTVTILDLFCYSFLFFSFFFRLSSSTSFCFLFPPPSYSNRIPSCHKSTINKNHIISFSDFKRQYRAC